MKLSIRGRVLMLVFTSVFAALLLLGAVAFHTVHSSRLIIERQAEILEKSVSEDELRRMENFKEMTEEVIEDSQRKAGLVLLPLLLLIVCISNIMAERVTRPIRQLADGVQEIATGNLEKKVEIHTGDEIEHLADCFNTMTDELQTYIKHLTAATAEKERIATALSVARDIQAEALPKDFMREQQRFQIYADMIASLDVGGDFYDFYMPDENHLVVTIADVCGKGIPAALFMMRAKTALKNMVLMANDPDDLATIMTLTNRELCQDNGGKMFVTVWLGRLDLVTGELIYVNGGHNPPFVRQKGECRYLRQQKYHLAPGLWNTAVYEAHRLTLLPGDMLFLYTDGVTEAMNRNDEPYTDQRLKAKLESMDEKISMQEMLSSVKADIEAHEDGTEQSDDITMLGLRFG